MRSLAFLLLFISLVFLTSCSPVIKTDPEDLYDEIDINRAITGNNLNDVKRYFANYPTRINQQTREGYTPLILAVAADNKQIAEYLLFKGADVNGKDKSGMTALHKAVCRDNPEMVKLLLSRGADINATAQNGWTPLHFAPGKASPEVVSILLEKKPNVNAQDNDGNTPLHLAIIKGKMNIEHVLFQSGQADYNIKNKRGITPRRLGEKRYKLREVRKKDPKKTPGPNPDLLLDPFSDPNPMITPELILPPDKAKQNGKSALPPKATPPAPAVTTPPGSPTPEISTQESSPVIPTSVSPTM